MDTAIRRLDARAMLVGMSGRVHKVICEKVETAFSQRKVRAVHVPDAAAARDRVATSMPQVVVLLGRPAEDPMRDTLADCAGAVGAEVVYIDPALGDAQLEEVINDAVDTAIKRKILFDARARSPQSDAPPVLGPRAGSVVRDDAGDDDIDGGW